MSNVTRCLLNAVLLILGGCAISTPGVVRRPDNPVVTMDAGAVHYGGTNWWESHYLVDQRMQSCWFETSNGLAPLDCCMLAARVPEAKQFIPWADANASACTARSLAPH